MTKKDSKTADYTKEQARMEAREGAWDKMKQYEYGLLAQRKLSFGDGQGADILIDKEINYDEAFSEYYKIHRARNLPQAVQDATGLFHGLYHKHVEALHVSDLSKAYEVILNKANEEQKKTFLDVLNDERYNGKTVGDLENMIHRAENKIKGNKERPGSYSNEEIEEANKIVNEHKNYRVVRGSLTDLYTDELASLNKEDMCQEKLKNAVSEIKK